jgi:hypothetical protein
MAKLLKYMTEAEREAVRAGSSTVPLCTRENGVQGSTMRRLERGQLADVWRENGVLVYRLTDEGGMMRAGLLLAEQEACLCRPGAVESGGFSSRCPIHGIGA